MGKKCNIIIGLNVILLFYSLSGVFIKIAAQYDVLSFNFILFYIMGILLLGIYAICWQQIIKRVPLTIAYANKAIVIVWGMIWGTLLFGEKISAGHLLGAIIVVFGVVLYSTDKGETE